MPIAVLLLGLPTQLAVAQNTSQENLPQQIQQLTDTMARTQAQLQESQRQLDAMRIQLNELKRALGQNTATGASSADSETTRESKKAPETATEAIQEIRDRQGMLETQIGVHDQTKVESESRYPVKITGLLLLNGFVNSGAVDQPATPTLAIPGAGSTGASVRQTILGVDARGPHLFGGRSYANLRVDFNGRPAAASNAASDSGYYGANAMLLRFRTARAALQWSRTEAYFSFDRPIFSPDMPDSLTAIAESPLAWSGDLWTWNPQLGVTQAFAPPGSRGLRLQAALIDAGDAPLSLALSGPAGAIPPTGAERSRWPGVEARAALLGAGRDLERSHFGVGGYFAPHRNSLGYSFDSWAGTLDAKLLLPARLQFAGSFYRGLALGGLGGGAYKDFAYRFDEDTGGYYFRPLDDVGGWAQLKEKLNERLEFNAAFGIDNVFASELRSYYNPGASMAQNLARNRTYTGNVIYRPSAYLLFSLEYRHLESSPVIGSSAESNIVGLGAGYKF
ncbi:MAG: hypothetical protein WBD10_14025 [Acidobacteriaceae bacterium]